MKKAEIIERNILSEVAFIFSRSGGAGGQNVNKVNTKAELRFNIDLSEKLSDEEKETIKSKGKSYINNNSDLIITSQEARSQLENKEICIDKFILLFEKWTKPSKPRIKTKRSKASIEKRLSEKSKRSDIKTIRNSQINLD